MSKRKESTPSRSASSKRVISLDNEKKIKVDSDESNDDIKRLIEEMALMSRDIRKLKTPKRYNKYRSNDKRFDDRYKPRKGMKKGITTKKGEMMGINHEKGMKINMFQKKGVKIVTTTKMGTEEKEGLTIIIRPINM